MTIAEPVQTSRFVWSGVGLYCFFFSSRRRHTRCSRDWSSDVCSSDLVYLVAVLVLVAAFFVPGGPTGAGWTLYPPQAVLPGTPGASWGIVLMLLSLAILDRKSVV